MMKDYPEKMGEIVSLKSKNNFSNDIPTIAIKRIESPNMLDINFIYDDWEKFFSV